MPIFLKEKDTVLEFKGLFYILRELNPGDRCYTQTANGNTEGHGTDPATRALECLVEENMWLEKETGQCDDAKKSPYLLSELS